MQQQEIKMGSIVYEINRVYDGNCSIGQLVADRIVHQSLQMTVSHHSNERKV